MSEHADSLPGPAAGLSPFCHDYHHHPPPFHFRTYSHKFHHSVHDLVVFRNMSFTTVTRSHFCLQQHVQRLMAQRHISHCLTTIATRSTIDRRRNLSSAVGRVAFTHYGDDTLNNKKSIPHIILLSVAATVATIIGAASLNTDNNSNNKSSHHQQWKHSNNNDTKTSPSSRFQESSPRYRYLYGFPIFPPLLEITTLCKYNSPFWSIPLTFLPHPTTTTAKTLAEPFQRIQRNTPLQLSQRHSLDKMLKRMRSVSGRGLNEKYKVDWNIVLGEGAFGAVHPARLALTGEKVRQVVP
jgi:hypothetical protein